MGRNVHATRIPVVVLVWGYDTNRQTDRRRCFALLFFALHFVTLLFVALLCSAPILHKIREDMKGEERKNEARRGGADGAKRARHLTPASCCGLRIGH